MHTQQVALAAICHHLPILLHHSYIQTWDIVPRVMMVFIWCSSCLLALEGLMDRYLSSTPWSHSLNFNVKSLHLAVGQELHGLASVLEEEGPKSLVSLQDLLIAWAIAGTSVTLTNGHLYLLQ